MLNTKIIVWKFGTLHINGYCLSSEDNCLHTRQIHWVTNLFSSQSIIRFKKISCFPVKAEKGRSSSTVSESESAVSQTHHYYVYPLWISKLRSITISLIRSTITNEWSNKRTRHIWSNHVHPVLSINSCFDCLPESFTCCVHIIILLISPTYMQKITASSARH